MNETFITVVGALGGDPELRFTPSGAAVANFSVATSARLFDKQTQEWSDGPTTWYACAAWRELAENVAESLQKGARVVVYGSLVNRRYEKQDGTPGFSLDLNVQAIGPDLRFATATVSTSPRRSGGGGQSQEPPRREQGSRTPSDPWGTPEQQGPQQADPWGAPQARDVEPPF